MHLPLKEYLARTITTGLKLNSAWLILTRASSVYYLGWFSHNCGVIANCKLVIVATSSPDFGYGQILWFKYQTAGGKYN